MLKTSAHLNLYAKLLLQQSFELLIGVLWGNTGSEEFYVIRLRWWERVEGSG